MGTKSKGLGRGLSDVLRDHDVGEVKEMAEAQERNLVALERIPLNLVEPNPFQPRRVFGEDELNELASNIKEHGLLQPISVRKQGSKYQIVMGERRVRAMRIAGIVECEAKVYELLSDKAMAELALIENVQREGLNPIETATAYERLLDEFHYTHEDLASRMGKSRSAITNTLRLLKLPKEVQDYVSEGKLSAGAARALLSETISDPVALAKQIIEEGLSVRAVEDLGKGGSPCPPSTSKPRSASVTPPLDADMELFATHIQERLGTTVRLKSNPKKPFYGQIVIDYCGLEDLERLRGLLL
jgi:ParB family chromosome partitioning protein